jgi:hypothetical protein
VITARAPAPSTFTPVVEADGRGGFVLRVADGDAEELVGDAPAWPGRTAPCRADDVVDAFACVAAAADDGGDVIDLADAVRRHPAPAAWAAWQAGLALVARRRGCSRGAAIAADLGLACAPAVQSAGLVVDAMDGVVTAGVGTPTLKWKTPPADARTLRSFRAASPTTWLRLDGNQRLSLDEATLLADVAGDRLQFVEEPCLPALLGHAARRFPLALDETLVDLGLDVDDALQLGAVCLVLKPATLGPASALALGRRARRSGLDVVVSTVGEGPAGMRALVALHAVLGTLDAGLGMWSWRPDTHALFADDGRFVGGPP